MDTTTATVATGIVVTLGQWNKQKKVTSKVLVGTAGVAIFLALIANANEKLASQFATLILVAAIMFYGIDIAELVAGGSRQGFGSKPK